MKTISFELEDDTAQKLDELCAKWGIGAGELVSLFAKQTVREQRAFLSFSVSSQNAEKQDAESFVDRCDPETLLNFIQNADFFTTAAVLSTLSDSKSSILIECLPPEKQADVLEILARGTSISKSVFDAIISDAQKRIMLNEKAEMRTVGGLERAVGLLNLISRKAERSVIKHLEGRDSVLAEEVKQRMFVFEDVVLLDDRSVQKVMRETDCHDIALALKGADKEVQEKFFRNMARGTAKAMKEDLEFMGPIPLCKAEAAQQKIVGTIRLLEERGEIVIERGREEDFVL